MSRHPFAPSLSKGAGPAGARRRELLDELVKTIETLKERISTHDAVLRASEAQTRYSLIDPLLRALGWDTAGPALVRPEYVVSGRRADYALLDAQGGVVVFLEAKSLGEQLTNNHRSQVTGYANELGIRYPALTNGSEWEVYDNQKLAPIEQRCVLNVSLASEDSAKSALKLLLLWHPNMASGQPIGAGHPILEVELPAHSASSVDDTNHFNIRRNVDPVQPIPAPNVPATPAAGWIPLTSLVAVKGSKGPSKVRFPGQLERDIKNWKSLLTEVANWLVRTNALTLTNGVVMAGRSTGYCTVNLEPKNLNGIGFKSFERLSNGLCLDVNFSAADCIKHSKAIIEHCRRDPATVHVQVG